MGVPDAPRLCQALLPHRKLEERLQAERCPVLAVVLHDVLARGGGGLELGAHDALDAGPHVLQAREEDARLVVDVLPAAHDVAVHQHRQVEAHGLRHRARRGVRHARREHRARLLQHLQELVPGRKLVDGELPRVHKRLELRLVLHGPRGDHLEPHLHHDQQALSGHCVVAVVVVPHAAIVNIQKIPLLLHVFGDEAAAAVIALPHHKVALAHEDARHAGGQDLLRVALAVQEAVKRLIHEPVLWVVVDVAAIMWVDDLRGVVLKGGDAHCNVARVLQPPKGAALLLPDPVLVRVGAADAQDAGLAAIQVADDLVRQLRDHLPAGDLVPRPPRLNRACRAPLRVDFLGAPLHLLVQVQRAFPLLPGQQVLRGAPDVVVDELREVGEAQVVWHAQRAVHARQGVPYQRGRRCGVVLLDGGRGLRQLDAHVLLHALGYLGGRAMQLL
mmetsp:Transcript_26773/g.67364  ORF Transcript_26773/g.67364 Transcript_26773/m.67364 type:complete len:445 (-) Transcript_26773:795-2129(-)